MSAVVLGSVVRDGFQDLDGVGAAVRRAEGGLLTDLLADDGGAQRRARRVDGDRRAALLAGGEQERHLVVVPGEPDGDRHARADHALRAGRRADARVVQHVLKSDDPRLDMTLLVLGRVVTAVLTQVAFRPGGLDLLGDIDAPRSGEMVEFGLKPVVRLLGQPGDAVIARLGHGYSSVRTGHATLHAPRTGAV